jgi:RNA recognition motif-containing protein
MQSEYKVYVKGLTLKSETKKEADEGKRLLREHFEKCGSITRIFIKNDFAFISFETEESRDEAVKLNGSIFQDKPIDVKVSKDNRTEKPKEESNWGVSDKNDKSKSDAKNWSTW